jgi:tetratricopeptide (TPR) repeat protein
MSLAVRTSLAARSARLVQQGCALATVLVCLSSGCCLWRKQSPVSESLMASRQFAQQGVNAFDRRDLDEAERLLGQAVRACPEDADAKRRFAEVLWEKGRRREALEQIDAALAVAPDDVAVLMRAGELHLQAGQTAQAMADVQRVIDMNPKGAEVWALRGRIAQQQGNSRQALADLQRALQYDPRNREALRSVIGLYRTLGEPQRSLVTLQVLADTYSPGEEPQQLYVDEALTYAALARHDDAARALRQAQRRGETTPDLLLMLAEAEAAAGHTAAAYQVAQQASSLAPGDPRCQALLQRTTAAIPVVDGTLRR